MMQIVEVRIRVEPSNQMSGSGIKPDMGNDDKERLKAKGGNRLYGVSDQLDSSISQFHSIYNWFWFWSSIFWNGKIGG